jgi:hypothetical protein
LLKKNRPLKVEGGGSVTFQSHYMTTCSRNTFSSTPRPAHGVHRSVVRHVPALGLAFAEPHTLVLVELTEAILQVLRAEPTYPNLL